MQIVDNLSRSGRYRTHAPLEYREPCSIKRTRDQWFLFLAFTLITSSTLIGCYPVKSRSDAVGRYELYAARNRIALDVLSDGNFTETITWPLGKVDKREGKWNWTS